MPLSVTYIQIVIISIYTNICKFEWKEKTNLRKRKKKKEKREKRRRSRQLCSGSQDLFFFSREELTDNACINITENFFFQISPLFLPLSVNGTVVCYFQRYSIELKFVFVLLVPEYKPQHITCCKVSSLLRSCC